ncbi:MAG: UvrD-helicase domain-containing protein, partial [Proteobacteria bacterium]|nr:UvrD-helicase domain-containing protein [Candidatus Avisuccinivibrio stercorigallinarum]
MQLNPAQTEAVNYIDGPCLVLAGAGSGKTRVITEKIVKLYKSCALPPERICALTFTNKAAAEMRERAKKSLPPEVAARLWISTFHSLGLEILRLDHQAFSLARNFTLFDEQDIKKALRDIVRSDFQALLRDEAESEVIDAAQNAISLWKGRLLAPEEIDSGNVNLEIYKSYQLFLK